MTEMFSHLPEPSKTDIFEIIHNLRYGFMCAGFEPPAVLLLDDRRQAHKLVAELYRLNKDYVVVNTHNVGKPIEHPDGSVWMEIDLMGIKIRWPALKYAQSNGLYTWT